MTNKSGMSKKPETMKKRVATLHDAQVTARLGGGEARIAKQH